MLRSQIDCNNQRKGFGWKQVKKIKKVVSVKIRQIFLPELYVPKIKERSESAKFHFHEDVRPTIISSPFEPLVEIHHYCEIGQDGGF